MKRKTILTIELERVRIITRKPERRVLFCEVCGKTGEFVSVAEAAELAKFIGIDSPEIFHFYQTTGNFIFVCLNSIFDTPNPD